LKSCRIAPGKEYPQYRDDREQAILVATQHSASEFEWFVHKPIALSAGLSPQILAAIKEGKTPVGLASRQYCIIDVVGELFSTKTLSEECFLAAQSELNNECLIEIIVIAGFYKLLAFVLNAFDVQVPNIQQ
jgi:4-carboxymuconolactone decarboxylase